LKLKSNINILIEKKLILSYRYLISLKIRLKLSQML